MKLIMERWNRFIAEAEMEEGIDQKTGEHDGRYYAFDWDDNLLKMPTKVYFDVNGKEVGIETSKFAVIRDLIGKPGEYEDYKYIEKRSFRDFREEGDEQFLKDLDTSPPTAKSWDDFVEAINTASIFAIITARGHNPETLKEGVRKLIDMEYEGISIDKLEESLQKYSEITGDSKLTIDGYLNLCQFSPVSFGIEDGAANPEQLKVQAMSKFIKYVTNLNSQMGIAAAPEVKIGFSDDDYKNYESISKHFPHITTKYTGKPIEEPQK